MNYDSIKLNQTRTSYNHIYRKSSEHSDDSRDTRSAKAKAPLSASFLLASEILLNNSKFLNCSLLWSKQLTIITVEKRPNSILVRKQSGQLPRQLNGHGFSLDMGDLFASTTTKSGGMSKSICLFRSEHSILRLVI